MEVAGRQLVDVEERANSSPPTSGAASATRSNRRGCAKRSVKASARVADWIEGLTRSVSSRTGCNGSDLKSGPGDVVARRRRGSRCALRHLPPRFQYGLASTTRTLANASRSPHEMDSVIIKTELLGFRRRASLIFCSTASGSAVTASVF